MTRPTPKGATAAHPAPQKTNWALVISLVGLLVGSGIIWKATDLIGQRQAPRFAISLLNDPTGRKEYEVSYYLVQIGPPPTARLDMGVEVRPTYSGASQGRVQVIVRDPGDRTVGQAEWPSFDKSAGPLQVKFDWAALAAGLSPAGSLSGTLASGRSQPPTLYTVSVLSSEGKTLATDTFTIRQTPWDHFTRVVPNFIGDVSQPVTVLVRGHNQGAPGQFALLTEVYPMTTADQSAPAFGKPFNPWPKQFFTYTDIGRVEAGAAFTATQQIMPAQFTFRTGVCYTIKTFAMKKLPYIDFPGVTWTAGEEAWRLGDWEDYSLVCCPANKE
jgi:hypothetical protein